jgi:hypothetical protein
MKLSIFFFSFASVWHYVRRQEQESTFLHGSDVEVMMAEEAKPATSGKDTPFHE